MEETTLEPRGFMQKLAAYPKKKPGAVLSLETMLYIAIIIIFVAIGIGIFSQRESAKIAACNQELDQIRSAVIQYSSLRASDDNDLDDLSKLFKAEAISADEAVDGASHGYFLQETGRWKHGSQGGDQVLNPWGDDSYHYDADTGKIYTEHTPLGGGDKKRYEILVGQTGS